MKEEGGLMIIQRTGLSISSCISVVSFSVDSVSLV